MTTALRVRVALKARSAGEADSSRTIKMTMQDEPDVSAGPRNSLLLGKLIQMKLQGIERRCRLLIADDDPVIQSMLSMSLGGGFDLVGVAADADAATALAATTQPDAALVDVDMPKGGGPAAVRGILNVSPDTAIVVLSADESDSMVRRLVEAGAVRYCRKGIGARELSEAVVESVRVRAHERHDFRRS